MSVPALLPLAGAAAGAVATGAGKALHQGLAFLTELTRQGDEAAATGEAAETGEPAAIPLDDPRQKQFAAALKQFGDMLRQRLQSLGVTGDTVRLGEQSWGGVGVEGTHPQQETIDSLFANDPLLASQFHALAEQYRQLQGGDGQISEFTRRDQFSVTLAGDEALPALAPR